MKTRLVDDLEYADAAQAVEDGRIAEWEREADASEPQPKAVSLFDRFMALFTTNLAK